MPLGEFLYASRSHLALQKDSCCLINPRNFSCWDQLAVVRNIDWANAHCEVAARVVRRAASESPSGSWPCMIAQVVGQEYERHDRESCLDRLLLRMVGVTVFRTTAKKRCLLS